MSRVTAWPNMPVLPWRSPVDFARPGETKSVGVPKTCAATKSDEKRYKFKKCLIIKHLRALQGISYSASVSKRTQGFIPCAMGVSI